MLPDLSRSCYVGTDATKYYNTHEPHCLSLLRSQSKRIWGDRYEQSAAAWLQNSSKIIDDFSTVALRGQRLILAFTHESTYLLAIVLAWAILSD